MGRSHDYLYDNWKKLLSAVALMRIFVDTRAKRYTPGVTMQALELLKNRLATITDINLANSILYWDQATMLPMDGSDQRGRQIATLTKISHDMFIAKDTGDLIDQLLPWASSQPEPSTDAILIREAKRQRDLEVKVPSELNAEISELYSKLYTAWTIAKPKNDFKTVQPLLERAIELNLKFADCFSGCDHPMDALIQFGDRGVTVKSTRDMFAKLREQLIPLVKKVSAAKQIDSSCLTGDFSKDAQLKFCKLVAEGLGYEFKRGRMDLSPHPFMTRLSGGDVRITTRVREGDMTDCLFSVIHEVGHALYELGISPSLDGNILGGGVSSGVHESQSRLWENRVGRGKPFWDFFYPKLQSAFPHFETVGQDKFLRAINKVEPGLIRVDADELTYNLHVMIRFDLECQLMERRLKVTDLPEAWNARYKSDLDLTVPDMARGCMQDVHWFSGRLGYFQGYTIGNILSAQFYDAAAKANAGMELDFAQGDFSKLKQWLNKELHQYGSMFSPDDVVKKATGQSMTIDPYMSYLEHKYSSLYSIR